MTTSTTDVRVSGVDAIFFSVHDVARARAFYQGLLDVREATFDSDHGAEYILADGTAFGFGKYSSGEWKASGCVLFAVPDVEAAAKRVTELGGTLVDGVREFPSCRAQWCEDPDGNSFVLHHRTKP